jgi:hypothetical protein
MRPLGRSIKPTIQNSVGSPIGMVKGIGRLGLALCVFFLLVPTGMSQTTPRQHHNQDHPDDAPQIIIDQYQGILVESSLNITGSYVDEELPTSMTWKITNALELVAEGDLVGNLSESDSLHESSRDSWQFSLNVNISSYAPCSCILEISTTDTNNQHNVAQLILFSHDGADDSQLPPSIILEKPHEHLTGTVELHAIAMDDNGHPVVQWAITNSSGIASDCAQNWIETPDTVQWHSLTEDQVPHPSQMWAFDTTIYEDGEFSLIVRAVAEDGLYSTCACQTVGIDNHAPTAIIEGPTDLNEYTGTVLFDGTGSSDQYWGREELVFLWVLENELGEKTIESGGDLRTFETDASRSGNYTLTLTVADGVGFSDVITHQFNITNTAPVAALRIAGQALIDGDVITLVDDGQWLLECGDSVDSDNDKSGLTCTWYIDNEPMMTGWERQLQKPVDLSTSHSLMLEVTDDDGEMDTITVTFGIQGTPSDPMYNADTEGGYGFWLMMMIFGLILVVLRATMTLRRYFSGNSTPIPKWKRK